MQQRLQLGRRAMLVAVVVGVVAVAREREEPGNSILGCRGFHLGTCFLAGRNRRQLQVGRIAGGSNLLGSMRCLLGNC